MVDILDEISDRETVETLQEGRKAIKEGNKGEGSRYCRTNIEGQPNVLI